MVDPQRVRHLLALYRRYRGYLAQLADRPDEDLRSDFAIMGGVQHYLLLAIETVIDLGSHVVSSEGFSPPTPTATSSESSAKRRSFRRTWPKD